MAEAAEGVEITGFVEMAEQRSRGSRITLYLTSFGRPGITAPERARVTLASRTPPKVGEHVRVRASLAPPPGPAYPGGFDFGRLAWFEGIGATGFALGRAASAPTSAQAPPGLALSAWLAQARAAIATRIRASLLPPAAPGGQADTKAGEAAIAVALVTGLRDGVPEAIEESMRISGLSHVLSISGLHMALVATGMFFLVRALLALSPDLALRFPIKNWAALPAVLAATFYLALSGAEVATQRAYVMTLIVLAGIILGRPALTLRTLALAAFTVLALTPWAVLDPGAQMSFAATLALVAAYGRWGGWVPALAPGGGRRWLHAPMVYLAALVLTSLAAGLATAPFAAYHFQRLAPLSLLANLAAMPVVSFVVMPAGLAGALLIPFGWDDPAWRLMGWGIELMVAISRAVAEVPGADRALAALPLASLICFALALAALCLLRSGLVIVAPVLALAGILLAPTASRPDLLVDREGRTVAVRQADGRLAVMGDRDRGLAGRFVVEQWLSAEGDRARLDDAALTQAARCDPLGCTLRTPQGEVIALSRHRDSLEEDCRRAALLVTTAAPPSDCAARVLRIDPARRTSALAVFREERATGRSADAPPPSGSRVGPAQEALVAHGLVPHGPQMEAEGAETESPGAEHQQANRADPAPADTERAGLPLIPLGRGLNIGDGGDAQPALEPNATPVITRNSYGALWRVVEARPAEGSRPWLPPARQISAEPTAAALPAGRAGSVSPPSHIVDAARAGAVSDSTEAQ
nr:ComEC/Rec2 family competence protein [Ancylobacter radicis]